MSAVHAGYAKRRKALLQAGIALFESKRLSAAAKPLKAGFANSSSASSLHAKTFAVDGRQVFIGSFNFDPRSSQLNTEMGFVIASAALARRVSAAFDTHVTTRAYEVHLARGGKLYWLRGPESRSSGSMQSLVRLSGSGQGFKRFRYSRSNRYCERVWYIFYRGRVDAVVRHCWPFL